MRPNSDVVIVFAKYPTPGRVKTRLIGALTAEQAAEVHRRCLQLTLEAVCAVGGRDVVLAASPDEADFSAMIDQQIEVIPQGRGDLGQRLNRAFEAAFDARCRRVLVVGSDCPEMNSADIRIAFDAMSRFDAIIGPATDGGYYLLGLRKAEATLFESIDWSTDRVLAQTTARAAKAGLKWAMLETRRDLDDAEDIKALLRDKAQGDRTLVDFKRFLRSLMKN